MIKGIIDFLTGFGNTKPIKKKRVMLTEIFVMDIEVRITRGDTKRSIIKDYDISDTTYRRIQNGTHRFSTIMKQNKG